MNPAYIFPIVMLLLVLLWMRQNQQMTLKKMIQKKHKGEREVMLKLAQKFIDKECIVYTFNSQINGIVKEVSDGAVLLVNNGVEEAVNVDFIVRIREYPRKKNGKKKSVVLD